MSAEQFLELAGIPLLLFVILMYLRNETVDYEGYYRNTGQEQATGEGRGCVCQSCRTAYGLFCSGDAFDDGAFYSGISTRRWRKLLSAP